MSITNAKKIIGIHLKFFYLVNLLSYREAALSPENLENTSNFEGLGLTLVAYKKSVMLI